MKTICFDMDGVICKQTSGDYVNAMPVKGAIDIINRLYDKGHRIIIHTSRFMGRNNSDVIKTHKEGFDFTAKQLTSFGVKFHELIMGKPRYDILVDDKAVFFRRDWIAIEREIECQK